MRSPSNAACRRRCICWLFLEQVIAIDEAQFFPDLAEFCAKAVDDHGKHVIVAGLSGERGTPQAWRRQARGHTLQCAAVHARTSGAAAGGAQLGRGLRAELLASRVC